MLRPFEHHVLSISTDNGTEFAERKYIAKMLHTKVYCAHPYSSWEKGLIENTNKNIRHYIPQKHRLSSLSVGYILYVQTEINLLPRRLLNISSSKQKLCTTVPHFEVESTGALFFASGQYYWLQSVIESMKMNRVAKMAVFAMLAVLVALPAQARKKNKYEITLTIQGGADTVMYMGHYYAKGNTVVDTSYRDKKGRFVFSGADTLPNGLYFFANPRGMYVEFVVYKEKPFFTFETKQRDWTGDMKVKGSKQNEFFYDFHHIDVAFAKDLDEKSGKMDSAQFARYRYGKLLELDSIKMDMIEKHPDMFLSKMMLATKEVEPPVVDEKGDSLTFEQRRDYYLEHYFDNMMLNDNAIVRTPKDVFYNRVMNFYDNVLKFSPPEVIIRYMDPMLERSKGAPDVFMYLVMTLTQKYLQSNVMVYDEVYVHLVQKYYASGDNFWSSPSSIDKEVQRATKWERLLVGKVAPELILFDTVNVPHSLHAFPHKWKLLVFWSPNCGHCKHIIPAVYKAFAKYSQQYDIGAFTILSDPDDKTRVEWRKFLAENGMNSPAWLSLDGGEANVDWHDVYDITTTPQIYLIDENNVIQAKKLGEESIEKVITAICGQQ